jgi:AcrR family transcriptional regulator
MPPQATVARRADAQRNRARIVAAARELLATHGVEASLREIARRAGVGVGTLYRHFPTREELVDAVLADAFADVLARGRAALETDDAWAGFTGFIEDVLVLHARNRGLRDVVETRAHGRGQLAGMRRCTGELVARLVARAQAQGSLRADFAPEDVSLIFWASDRVRELGGDVAPDIWRRHLGFVFDGLRSTAATPLSPPPLSERQLAGIGA